MEQTARGTGVLQDGGAAGFRLRCFGDFALTEADGEPILIPLRKGRALIAFLAMTEPASAGRARLMALLWSDRSEPQARASLRNLLANLKSLTGPGGPIEASRERVALVKGLIEPETEMLRRLSQGRLAAFVAALGHVQRDLFSDLDHIGEGFDEWLRLERTRRLDALFDAAIRAGRAGLADGEIDDVRALATQLERIDPAHEGAVQLGLEADAAAGDGSGIHRRYRRLKEFLALELGAAPDVETDAIYRRVIETKRPLPPAPPREVAKATPNARAGLWRRAAAIGSMLTTLSLGHSSLLPVARTSVAAESRAQVTLAVLPFADLSPGGGNRWFAEGVAEEIIGSLSTQADIQLIGRSSAMSLAPNAGFDEARRRLGASHLLEGSVRRNEDRVRVAVRLVRTSDGRQMWGELFDRRLGDVFAIQDEVGAAVLDRLARNRSQPRPLRSARTRPDVFDLYLTANSHARRRTLESLMEAQRLLREAIRRDPAYAPGYARLGLNIEVIETLRPQGRSRNRRLIEQQMRDLAQRALRLDSNIAEAYVVLGLSESRNTTRRQHYLERATELDPGNAFAWNYRGAESWGFCNPRRALGEFRRAAEIEPLLSTPWLNLATLMLQLGRDGEGVALIRRLDSLQGHPARAHHLLSNLALERGDLSQAVTLARQALVRGGEDVNTRLTLAFALVSLGEDAAATRTLPGRDRELLGPYWMGNYRATAAQVDDLWGPRWRRFAMFNALYRAGATARMVAMFDRDFGALDGFSREVGCLRFAQLAPTLILALRREGRLADAAAFSRLAGTRLRQAYQAGYAPRMVDPIAAALAAVNGDRDGALAILSNSVAGGWLSQWEPFVRLDDPAFDSIRSDIRFRTIVRRRSAEIARERRELASAPVMEANSG